MITHVIFKIKNDVHSFPEDCEMVCCSTDLQKIEDKYDELEEERINLDIEDQDFWYDVLEVNSL